MTSRAETKLLQRRLEVLNVEGREPNWTLIKECPIWPILGASECENCETYVKCWGEDADLELVTEGQAKIRMTEEEQRQAAFEGVWYPTCPYCREDAAAEPGVLSILCNTCGNTFQIENPI